MAVLIVFQVVLLLCSILLIEGQNKPGCQAQCGNVGIPYPFGMKSGCYLEEGFRIDCNNVSNTPFLSGINMEVMEISVKNNALQVKFPIVYANCANKNRINTSVNLDGTPFVFSMVDNRFTAVGCDNLALITQNNTSTIGGCMSICDKNTPDTKSFNGTCNGVGCCQTTVPSNLKVFNVTLKGIDDSKSIGDQCKYAYIVNQTWLLNDRQTPYTVRDMEYVPVALEWQINSSVYESLLKNSLNPNSSYLSTARCWDPRNQSNINCYCRSGFQGNPYLRDGCQDINECEDPDNICNQQKMKCENLYGNFNCYTQSSRAKIIILGLSVGLGSLFLLIVTWWLAKILKKRRNRKLKEKYFKQNGGLLLQEQLSSGEVNVDKIKMFSSKELEKATDNYNVNRTLGQGGQGTVYKGMLADGRIVAVKKSKILDEDKLRQFINEIVILSQLNHRNVVKLLGCCLETEVPMLVYEFIPNGTLFECLHDQIEDVPSTWDMRLRIATDIAGALSYLHSSASMPIYHRDIKSTNILLDDKYRAKVADFGISRSVTIDQTHVTTLVQGTFGYLDPEYFQSSQFTDKSDVYSFGVVLVELLTGQKPISTTRSEETRGLVAYFILCMEDNRLFDILDSRVMTQGKKEDILTVAYLAKQCLSLTGKSRPTMREVTTKLEGIQKTLKVAFSVAAHENYEVEVEYHANEMMETWEVFSSSSTEYGLDSFISTGTGSSLDKKLLLPKK